MKIAFKTFLTTLKRYKASSVLNVVGLTAAFLAFYVIMAQVRYDLTFNHSIKDSERVYLTAVSRQMVNDRYTHSARIASQPSELLPRAPMWRWRVYCSARP